MCEVLSELFSKDFKLLFLVRDPFREIDRLLLLNSINSSEDMMKACEKSFLFNLNMLLRIKNGVDTNLLPFNNQGLYSSNINTYKLKKEEEVLRI